MAIYPYVVNGEKVFGLQPILNGAPVIGMSQDVFTIRNGDGVVVGRTLTRAEGQYASVGREACELLRDIDADMQNNTITREDLIAYRQRIGAILTRVPPQ